MDEIEKLLKSSENEGLRAGLLELLNLVEALHSENEQLRQENQALKDELKRLKGETARPPVKSKREKQDYSSERERRVPRRRRKGGKLAKIKIDREELIRLEPSQLPADAHSKGWRVVVVQDVKLVTDNVRFHKQRYYAPSSGQSYEGSLPAGYEGQFGPGVKALSLILYYLGQMTEPKIQAVFEAVGCQISRGQIAQLITAQAPAFAAEEQAAYEAGLRSSPWQHLDDTGAYVAGQLYHSHVVCNPLYTHYHTTAGKDRLSVVEVLSGPQPRRFRLDERALALLADLGLSRRKQNQVARLPQAQNFSQAEFEALLPPLALGPIQQQWLLSAAAVAAYHAQTAWPVVSLLIGDDAPQFKGITAQFAACWVHDGRHYKKLTPRLPGFQQELEQFQPDYWQFYHHLLAFRDCPSHKQAAYLREEFDRLFSRQYTVMPP
jgi:hypothetical protein